MLKVNIEPKYRGRCCGHSDAETVALTRLRCQECGQILPPSEVTLGMVGFTHRRDGSRCGPVLQERANSHAALVDWIWEVARHPEPDR
jgi:hypothetical protein